MLFAESVFDSTCFTLFLLMLLIAWGLKRREKQRQAESQRQLQQQYGQPPQPSLTRKVATGILAHLITGIIKATLGHRHHGHHHDKHGW